MCRAWFTLLNDPIALMDLLSPSRIEFEPLRMALSILAVC